jgi:hypothetical protein
VRSEEGKGRREKKNTPQLSVGIEGRKSAQTLQSALGPLMGAKSAEKYEKMNCLTLKEKRSR